MQDFYVRVFLIENLLKYLLKYLFYIFNIITLKS
jgi:hypothetical protein